MYLIGTASNRPITNIFVQDNPKSNNRAHKLIKTSVYFTKSPDIAKELDQLPVHEHRVPSVNEDL